MSTYMSLKTTSWREFLRTNVTKEPCAFIVCYQQMFPTLFASRETLLTVLTRVRFHAGVNQNVIIQFVLSFVLLYTVRTVIRSLLSVNVTYVCFEGAWNDETFITQRTFVRLVFHMNPGVVGKTWRTSERHAAHMALVHHLFAVNTTVRHQLTWCRKPFAANGATERLFPEWIRLCCSRDSFIEKHLPHTSHLYLLLCTTMCIFK